MAKSKAKKQREHLERNGQRNPEQSRMFSPDFSMHVRKNPTRHEKQMRQERKYKQQVCAY